MKVRLKNVVSVLAFTPLIIGAYSLVSCGPKNKVQDKNFKYTLKKDGTYELTSTRNELSTVTIPEKVQGVKITSIGNQAFMSQSQLSKVNLSTNLKSIGYASFMNCENLISVKFADDSHLETIGSHAFCGASNLIIDTFPSSVKNVGAFAFQFNRGISLMYLPKTIETLGAFAFEGCSNATFFVEDNAIPEGWDKTWNNANRPYLLDVNPEYGEVETRGNFKVLIGSEEAYLVGVINQSELTGELVLPVAVNDIPVKSMISNLFSPTAKNSKVTSLIIPEGYNIPDVHCFDGLDCANLYFSNKSVSEEWIKEFEEIHNGSTAYSNVTDSLTLNDLSYVLVNGTSYAVLTASSSTASELSVPASVNFTSQTDRHVEKIAPRTFRNNKNLTKITTTNSTHIIGAYAFYGCSSLTTLNLGDVIEIGKFAFSGSTSMSNLTDITAHSAEIIGEEAFKKTSQKHINIESLFPAALAARRTKYIGPSAFQNCLLENEKIYLGDDLEKVGQYTFNCADDTTTFYVTNVLFAKMKTWGYKITEYPGYYKIDSATKPFGNGHIVIG